MRAFLAIELPGALRVALGEVQRSLAAQTRGWRWSRAEGIHLTLRFLGEASSESLETGAPLWRAAASSVEPFAIRVSGLGVFPSARRARVLWAGVAEQPSSGRLADLAARVEQACRSAGFPADERPFSPHLTLARASAGPAQAPAAGREADCGEAPVLEVVLFRSDLRPQGAVHTPLERFPLGGGER